MLSKFQHEIFLSYGWAGNVLPDEGARQWAHQLQQWLANEIGADQHRPRIYYDETAPRAGPLPDRLQSAVEQSALFVFLASPGSCRPDSWCQKEFTWFWDHARPLVSGPEVAPPERRIFKVLQSGLSGDGLIDPLARWAFSSFDLCDTVQTDEGPRKRAGDLEHPSPGVFAAMQSLRDELGAAIDKIARLERTPAVTRVFLGPAFSPDADKRFLMLRRELLLQGCHVQSATPLPAQSETEGDHGVRIDRAMDGCRLAIHLIPEPQPPNGWQRNPAAWQLRKSLTKSAGDRAFSAYVWYDPDKAMFDTQCKRELDDNPVVSGDQDIRGKDFAYLTENVKDRLRKPVLFEGQDHAEYDVVIDHHDDDSVAAASIRDYIIGKGCRAQLTNAAPHRYRFQSTLRANIEQFYPHSRRFVVLYGNTSDIWANRLCREIRSFFARGVGRPGLVLTGPPPNPQNKVVFRAPVEGFETRQCLDGNYSAALDEWLGGPCR